MSDESTLDVVESIVQAHPGLVRTEISSANRDLVAPPEAAKALRALVAAGRVVTVDQRFYLPAAVPSASGAKARTKTPSPRAVDAPPKASAPAPSTTTAVPAPDAVDGPPVDTHPLHRLQAALEEAKDASEVALCDYVAALDDPVLSRLVSAALLGRDAAALQRLRAAPTTH